MVDLVETQQPTRRPLLVSKGWIQAVALVLLFGFAVMGLLAYRTYTAEPPIPDKVVDDNGRVLFTGRDVIHGQQVFLHNGLMEYGSIFGHGAYLGPDFTDGYLHRAVESVTRQLRRGLPSTLEEPEDVLFADITVPTTGEGREHEATAAYTTPSRS